MMNLFYTIIQYTTITSTQLQQCNELLKALKQSCFKSWNSDCYKASPFTLFFMYLSYPAFTFTVVNFSLICYFIWSFKGYFSSSFNEVNIEKESPLKGIWIFKASITFLQIAFYKMCTDL